MRSTMNKKSLRILSIAIAIFSTAFLFVSASPAKAETCSVSYFYDVSGGVPSTSSTSYTYVDSFGLLNDTDYTLFGQSSTLNGITFKSLVLMFTPSCAAHIRLNVNNWEDPLDREINPWFFGYYTIATDTWYVNNIGPLEWRVSVEYDWSRAWFRSKNSTNFSVTFAYVGSEYAQPTGTSIPSPTPTGTPLAPEIGWTEPIRREDHGDGNIQSILSNQFLSQTEVDNLGLTGTASPMLAISNEPNARVHAAFSGSVFAVQRVTDCSYPPGTRIEPGWCKGFFTQAVGVLNYGYNLYYIDAYSVTIELDSTPTRKLTYIVASPTVHVGQTVSAGCIIGLTLKIKDIDFLVYHSSYGINGATLIFGWEYYGGDQGGSFYQAHFSEEPVSKICSNNTDNTSGCRLVGNADFDPNSPDAWEKNQYVYNGFGEMDFSAQGSIRQRLVLDSTHEYTITLFYKIPDGPLAAQNQTIYVQLGSNEPQTVNVQRSNYAIQSTTLSAQSYSPSQNIAGFSLYDFKIYSKSDKFNLTYACVLDTADDPVTADGGCIFYNPEFDTSQYWNVTGEFVDFSVAGIARMTSGESTISQTLTLSPKSTGAQSYLISVTARQHGSDSFQMLTPSWSSESFSPMHFTSTGDWQTKTATISVSSKTTAAFSLIHTAGSSGTWLDIDRVCVETGDGSAPPGYTSPGAGITPQCKVCTYQPTGDLTYDVPEIVRWLGCFISQLWYCQAKKILMGIWTVATSILTFLGFARMWLSAVISNLVNWANGNLRVFANYLNGLSVNMQGGVVQGDSGSSFWDVLRAALNTISNLGTSLIEGLRDVITTLVGGIVTLLIALFSFVLQLVGMILAFFSGIVANAIGMIITIFRSVLNGINAAPATLPEGIPNCTSWQINFAASQTIPNTVANATDSICGGLALLENELNGGTGTFIVPAVIGLGSFNLLIWAIRQYTGVLSGAADD